jgi:carbonic anhydrase
MNIRLVVDQLKASPALNDLIEKKKLIIVGGYYNFHSGLVEIFSTL